MDHETHLIVDVPEVERLMRSPLYRFQQWRKYLPARWQRLRWKLKSIPRGILGKVVCSRRGHWFLASCRPKPYACCKRCGKMKAAECRICGKEMEMWDFMATSRPSPDNPAVIEYAHTACAEAAQATHA